MEFSFHSNRMYSTLHSFWILRLPCYKSYLSRYICIALDISLYFLLWQVVSEERAIAERYAAERDAAERDARDKETRVLSLTRELDTAAEKVRDTF